MNKPIHPAVAEHVMEENERLRALLLGVLNTPRGTSGRIILEPDEEAAIRAALSQQAEPAPAQDERDSVIAHIELCITNLKAEHQTNPRVIAEVLYNIGYSRATRPAQTEQHPSTTQQILDLILEQCRYWHGRDEARRGGFACLYAQAKEIADNAAATAQPEHRPVAMVDANDDGMWADILPDVTVKVGQMLYAAPIAQTAPQTAAKMPCGTAVTNAYEAYEAGKRAAAPKPEKSVPEELFDGHAVYQETVRHRRDSGLLVRTSPENVSDTLDAVARLIKSRRAALSAQGESHEQGIG